MKEEFFVIDTDNLDNVTDGFIGYAIADGNVAFDVKSPDVLTGDGAYVAVSADEKSIRISQDYVGSFGIYCYRDEDYFALSNSFLKLIEHLKSTRRHFSFNRHYADYYLGTKTSVNTFSNTLINEIGMLESDVEIIIDKDDSSLSFKRLDYGEKSVNIESRDALEILDEWYFKWIDILRNIRRSTNSMSIDLSGGFDTRLVAALWLSANINLDNIMINSGRKEELAEDFKIASQIADDLDFKLNSPLNFEKVQISLEDYLSRTPYVKFGFDKQRFGFSTRSTSPRFRVSGHCGGTIRDHMNFTPEEYILKMKKMASYLSGELAESTGIILDMEFDRLVERFDVDERDSKSLPLILYNISRNRHHFGKEFANNYLYNFITIAPLSDPLLQKISFDIGGEDNLLLTCLILLRYSPKLLEYEFDSNRSIPESTIEKAGKINEISPFKPKEYDFIEGPEPVKVKNEKFTSNPLFKVYEDIFKTREFEMEFEKYYSKELYDKIRLGGRKGRNRSYDIYSAVEIIKTVSDVNDANNNSKNYADWIEGYNTEKSNNDLQIRSDSLCEKYATSRMDIKNFGTADNSIEIISNSNPYSKIEFPKWFDTDKGKGCVITSTHGEADLKIRAIGDGELSVKLKSTLNKDINARKFPVYIDYTSLTVDGEEILDENRLTTHDSPYEFKMKVKDSQIVNLHVEWLPFNKDSTFNNDEIELLEEKLERLEEENRKLKNVIDNASKSKANRLLSKFKRN